MYFAVLLLIKLSMGRLFAKMFALFDHPVMRKTVIQVAFHLRGENKSTLKKRKFAKGEELLKIDAGHPCSCIECNEYTLLLTQAIFSL